MFVRANTITQVALLCLMGFLFSYLWFAAREQRIDKAHPTWHFIRGLAAGTVVIAASMVGDVLETGLGDVALYFRGLFAVYFYYQMALFFYALPPASTHMRREASIFSKVLYVVMFGEIAYLIYRVADYWETATYMRRPLEGDLQVVFLVLWTAVLIGRRLIQAERAVAAPGASGSLRLFLQGLIRPRSSDAQVYRWFALTILTLVLLVFFFSVLPYRQLPLWIDVLLDGSLTVGVMVVVFVYLRYQLVPISLELRIVGAGLTIFLLTVHALSWGISLAYLGQTLPGVPYAEIFGSAQQPDFVVPGPYREVAQQLGELLLILIWFEIGGSLTFLLASAIYYRRTIIDALTELLAGFEQVEQGNLAHRIPRLAWQDEFSRIATAFNTMTDTLQMSSQEVQRYQAELEELVEKRTRQLAEEIEQRKALEVMQGIQAERNRIAQETHDGLLQSLAGIRIRLRRGKKLSQRAPEAIESELEELADELSHSALDLRRMINDLKLDMLELGLQATIRRVVESQERAYRVKIHTEMRFDENVLPIASRLVVLRLIQEGVSNACKHSCADQVWVSVQEDVREGSLRVCVKDEGQGFDPAQFSRGGWGLGNMRQRAEEIGGILHIQSQPGAGTQIDLCVPLGAIVEKSY